MCYASTFDFVYSVCTEEQTLAIAKTILEAQDIREDSWIKEETKYAFGHLESTAKAADIHLEGFFTGTEIDVVVNFISDMNMMCWNDVQMFAVAVLQENGIREWKGNDMSKW